MESARSRCAHAERARICVAVGRPIESPELHRALAAAPGKRRQIVTWPSYYFSVDFENVRTAP